MRKFFALASFLSVLLLSLNGCVDQESDQTQEPDTQEEVTYEVPEATTPVAEASTFAQWQDNTVDFAPSVANYKIESDLSNVEYTDILAGPVVKDKLLVQNGFYVAEGWSEEFFSIYEENRYEYTPNFITTDSVLHTYHLYFNFLLKSLEEEELYDLADSISKAMLDKSAEQYEELKGTEWEGAALRNVGFFAVAYRQLNPGGYIPDYVEEAVKTDLEAMTAHEGIARSATFGEEVPYEEDFSQYIPRGHYTKTEKLGKYFNALMWYGRMTLRLDKEDETKSALLMLAILDNNEDLLVDWKRLYEPIGFFVGGADDLVYYDYQPVALGVFGDLTLENLQAGSLNQFIEKAKTLRDPGVNSMPVLGPALAPDKASVEDRTEQVKGFRFLGQRFTIDASIFQKLIDFILLTAI